MEMELKKAPSNATMGIQLMEMGVLKVARKRFVEMIE